MFLNHDCKQLRPGLPFPLRFSHNFCMVLESAFKYANNPVVSFVEVAGQTVRNCSRPGGQRMEYQK